LYAGLVIKLNSIDSSHRRAVPIFLVYGWGNSQALGKLKNYRDNTKIISNILLRQEMGIGQAKFHFKVRKAQIRKFLGAFRYSEFTFLRSASLQTIKPQIFMIYPLSSFNNDFYFIQI
jgi:hypothetical protein